MFVHSNGIDQWLFLAVGESFAYGSLADTALVYDLDKEQWMPPWDFSSLNLFITAGGSLETSAGVFKAVVIGTAITLEFNRTKYDDADSGSFYVASATTNAMELPSKPDKLAAVRWVGVERGSGSTISAKLLVDDDPVSGSFTNLASITGNPVSDPRRTQGTYLIENHFHTESGPAGRRASVQLSWNAVDSNFKLYTIDVAYQEVDR
jgi:hypothetical protein